MKFEYFQDTDTLYIHLREGPAAEAREIAPDMVVDLDADNRVIGIEIEHASERADLTSLTWTGMLAGSRD